VDEDVFFADAIFADGYDFGLKRLVDTNALVFLFAEEQWFVLFEKQDIVVTVLLAG
jgi:hypothetical protein